VDVTNNLIEEPSDTTSDEDTDADQIPPKKPKEPAVKALIHPPPSRKSTMTKDLKNLKPEDMIPTPQKPRTLKRSSKDSELQGAAKRRSLTRSAIEPKKVNYDVKYHPMDKSTRPHAPATRKAREEYEENDGDEEVAEQDAEGEEEADDEDEVDTTSQRTLRGRGGKKANYDMAAHPLNPLFQTKISSRKSSSKAESLATEDEPAEPFADPVATSWELLDPLDQHLHEIQEGAPDNPKSLPFKWAEVVNILIEEGCFTRKQFDRFGRFSALRKRYEEIRQVAQGDYADMEPKDREDRRLYFREGFDVFDLDSTQTYVNQNIPEYMHGIKVFTSRDLAKREKEFIKAQKDAANDIQDTSMQDTSTSSPSAAKPDEPRPVAVTLGEPVNFEAVLTNALTNEIRRLDAENRNMTSAEDVGLALEDLASTDDVVMAMEEYGQGTPTPIILSGTASAAMTQPPSASQKEPAAKDMVALSASMISPLPQKELDAQIAAAQKAELAAQSIAATQAFINKQRKSTPSSSDNLIDTLSSLATASPSHQLLQEMQKTAIGGKAVAGTPKKQLPIGDNAITGPPKKQHPFGGETIPGTTRKQLQRGRRKIKVKPGSASNFEIHEDTPGNTPRAKPRRNAVTLDMLKENMPEELDEDGERATPIQEQLDALTARYDEDQARREAVAASPAGARAGLQHSSPEPLAVVTPTRPPRSLSGALPSTEDSDTGAAAATAAASPARGVQARTSGGVLVIVPRRRPRASDMM